MNIKQMRLIIIGIVIVFTFIGGFIFYYSQLRIKSRASAGIPTLSFVTSPTISANTGNFDLKVRVNPNNATFNAFELHIIFDPSKVDFQDKTNINANIIEISPNKLLRDQTKIDVANNKIIVVGFREGDAGITGWEDIDLVKVSMKLLPGATLPVLFTWDNATKIGANITTEKINGSFPVSDTPPDDPNKKGSIYFSSTKTNYIQGENMDVDVYITTGGEQVKASDIYIPFDSTKLDFQNSGDISKNVILLSGTGFNQSTSAVVLNEGKIRITLLTPISGGNPVAVQGNDIKVAKLLFKGKILGDIGLAADIANSNMYSISNKNVLGKAPVYSVKIEAQATIPDGEAQPTPETVKSNGDLLNINSSPIDQAPFRYEQQIVLDKGTYTLKASALTYTTRGRGVLVSLVCGEGNCGSGKTLNAIIASTPKFPISKEYQEQNVAVNIPEEGKNKKYLVRVFTDDGSEADFDYISLTNQWDGEQLSNIHFAQSESVNMSRKHPQMWEMDAAGKLFGTVDPNQGVQGALYINSISRQ